MSRMHRVQRAEYYFSKPVMGLIYHQQVVVLTYTVRRPYRSQVTAKASNSTRLYLQVIQACRRLEQEVEAGM